MGLADDLRKKRNRSLQTKKKRKIALLAIMTAIAVTVGIRLVVSDYTGVNIKEPITVEIANGMGASAAAKALKKAGAVNYGLLMKMKAAKVSIQPGPITVEPEMSYSEIASRLAEPNRGFKKVVIPEGFEVRQIVDRFVENGIDRDEMVAAVNSTDYDFEFLKELPKRENPLEGYLYPDTYHVTADDTARDVVNMMLAEFDKTFDKAYRAQAIGMGKSMDEIVTLASIIERETDQADERAKVAGVFYNRIEKKMNLQSCATVQYILKERKPNLSIEDTRIQSPYNTYINNGLPPGPIACPGKECIEAALFPEQTTALYFVMGKDGKHVFSETYEQHLKAKEAAGL